MTLPTRNAAPPSDGRSANANRSLAGRWRRWPQPWWLILGAFLIGNYILTQMFSPQSAAIGVPYTFFKQQVEAGNVETITSVGDSIEGQFRTEVTYPPKGSQAPNANPAGDGTPRTSIAFKTQRPTFADPGLETLLEKHGVHIEAVDQSRSS